MLKVIMILKIVTTAIIAIVKLYG